MEVRTLRKPEVGGFVDELWLPFAEEMAELDSRNALADDARDHAIQYRRDRVDDDAVATFLADDDGVIGFADVDIGEAGPVFERGLEASLRDLYVRPEHRSMGIGHLLLERVIEWASDRQCERIKLGVNEANNGAISFYEDNGFAIRRHKMARKLC